VPHLYQILVLLTVLLVRDDALVLLSVLSNARGAPSADRIVGAVAQDSVIMEIRFSGEVRTVQRSRGAGDPWGSWASREAFGPGEHILLPGQADSFYVVHPENGLASVVGQDLSVSRRFRVSPPGRIRAASAAAGQRSSIEAFTVLADGLDGTLTISMVGPDGETEEIASIQPSDVEWTDELPVTILAHESEIWLTQDGTTVWRLDRGGSRWARIDLTNEVRGDVNPSSPGSYLARRATRLIAVGPDQFVLSVFQPATASSTVLWLHRSGEVSARSRVVGLFRVEDVLPNDDLLVIRSLRGEQLAIYRHSSAGEEF